MFSTVCLNVRCDAVSQVAAVTSRGIGNWTEVKSITPKKGELFLFVVSHRVILFPKTVLPRPPLLCSD